MTSSEFTAAEIADTKYGLTFDRLESIVIESSQDHKFIGKSAIKGCQQSWFCNNLQLLFLTHFRQIFPLYPLKTSTFTDVFRRIREKTMA